MSSRSEVLAVSLRQHLADSHIAGALPSLAVFSFQGSIVVWVEQQLARIVDEQIDTPEERGSIRDAVLAVFDAWDIPQISGLSEQAVKQVLRDPLASIIDGLLGYADHLLAKPTAI